MVYYTILIFLLALYYSQFILVAYRNIKINSIKLAKMLNDDTDKITAYPFTAITMFSCSVFMYTQTGSVILSCFILVLAAIAYADLATRWIPDILIYILIVITLIDVEKQSLVIRGLGAVLFFTPPLFLNLYGYLKTKMCWIASGDFYVFFALGFWIQAEYAAVIILITLLIGALLMRLCNNVPLVTCVFPVFIGYKLCEANGVLLQFISL